jgi:hypothetical protein
MAAGLNIFLTHKLQKARIEKMILWLIEDCTGEMAYEGYIQKGTSWKKKTS